MIYPVQVSCKECYKLWDGNYILTPHHIIMKAALNKAIDVGIFYCNDMVDYVANELGVTQEQRDADKLEGKTRAVEGGPFAMEVYLARKVVESERFAASDAVIRDNLNLQVGQKLGKLRLSDYKYALGCTVDNLSVTSVVLSASRGGRRIKFQCSYTALHNYIERENTYKQQK